MFEIRWRMCLGSHVERAVHRYSSCFRQLIEDESTRGALLVKRESLQSCCGTARRVNYGGRGLPLPLWPRGTSPARHTLSYTLHRSKYTYDSVGFQCGDSIYDGRPVSRSAYRSTVIDWVLGLCVIPEGEISISMPLPIGSGSISISLEPACVIRRSSER